MLPKNLPQNNPPGAKKFSLPPRPGANKPEKPALGPTNTPLGGLRLPVTSQPVAPLNKPSALQPLSVKPAQQVEEGKENEVLMVEKLLQELSEYNYLYNKVAPATRAFWDDVKLRAKAQNNLSKSQLIADLRALINKLESTG